MARSPMPTASTSRTIFANGFIDSLHAETTDKTFISSPRAEYAGDARVYERTTYTACARAKTPTIAPLWRVRARKVIHRLDEQNLYFEDADLEFFGFPGRLLCRSSRCPTRDVKRRSGHSDPAHRLQVAAWLRLRRPDLLGDRAEHRPDLYADLLSRGRVCSANSSSSTVSTTASTAFASTASSPNEPRRVRQSAVRRIRTGRFRGSISSTGEFAINDRWKFGWDGALSERTVISCRTSSSTIRSTTTSSSARCPRPPISRARASRAISTCAPSRSRACRPRDYQPQIGFILPHARIQPGRSRCRRRRAFGLGGQVELDVNVDEHARGGGALRSDPAAHARFLLWRELRLSVLHAGRHAVVSSQCLLRGVGGDYGRATGQASWQRRFIDPIGQRHGRRSRSCAAPARYLNYDTSRESIRSTIRSASRFPTPRREPSSSARTMSRAPTSCPGIGLEYRYPFFAKTPFGSITVEPIAQIIARPDRGLGSNSLVNLDSQSLVFDDSTLFAWNKFSGYDRFETGTRVQLRRPVHAELPERRLPQRDGRPVRCRSRAEMASRQRTPPMSASRRASIHAPLRLRRPSRDRAELGLLFRREGPVRRQYFLA